MVPPFAKFPGPVVAAPRRGLCLPPGTFDGEPAAGRSAVTSRREDLVTLTVDGERWSRRSTFDDCGPDSRVFALRVSGEGGTILSFGDGIHGKALPHGSLLSLTIAPETPLPVSLERTQPEPSPDQPLWTVIRQRSDGTELELYAPCEDAGGRDRHAEAERRATRWRLLALIFGALLLALVLWR
jgi:hypothetical protein